MMEDGNRMSLLEQEIGGGITVWSLVLFLVVLAVAVIIGKTAYILIRRSLDDKAGRKTSKSIARFVQYTIIIVAAVFAFGMVLRLDLSGLVISLGLVGIAVAFASQQIIQNVIAGVIISITRPIQLEDWIEVGLGPETSVCRVKDITLMSTVLRETGGRIAIVPNSQIITGKVVNYTKSGFFAVSIPMWIQKVDDLEAIRKIVYDEADKDPRILPNVTGEEKTAFLKVFERPNIRAFFSNHGDLSVLDPQVNVIDIQGTRTLVRIKVWIRDVERRDEIVSFFLATIRKRFDAENIVLQNS
jgi:small conductance mechanosensitive channel